MSETSSPRGKVNKAARRSAAARLVKQTKAAVPIATGQFWQVPGGYVHITHLGKTLAQYKRILKLGQRAGKSGMSSVSSLQAYLTTNRAKLMPEPPPLPPREAASAKALPKSKPPPSIA